MAAVQLKYKLVPIDEYEGLHAEIEKLKKKVKKHKENIKNQSEKISELEAALDAKKSETATLCEGIVESYNVKFSEQSKNLTDFYNKFAQTNTT